MTLGGRWHSFSTQYPQGNKIDWDLVIDALVPRFLAGVLPRDYEFINFYLMRGFEN